MNYLEYMKERETEVSSLPQIEDKRGFENL
jgi:hypothetical protein